MNTISRILAFSDAVHSVALSHPDDHDCDVCKAAGGDRELLARLFVESEERRADSLGGEE